MERAARMLEKGAAARALAFLRGSGEPVSSEEREAMKAMRALASRRFSQALRQMESERAQYLDRSDRDQRG